MTAWAEHLSALEDAVTRTRAELLATDGDLRFLAPATQPDGSPADDVDRARRVLRQLHELVDDLAAARDHVARELALHRKMAAGRTGLTGPTYVDQRG